MQQNTYPSTMTMTMTSSLKNILMISLLTASSLVSATDLSSLEIDETKATADEVLSQYQALTDEMDAEAQLDKIDQQLDQENLELLQPICTEYSIDMDTGEEICTSQ
ncbi:hypothetical protein FM037_02105 [Shewanella psychropiezotolerans]|uniref:Orphan protein n=2 Tax=Shewanella TaxID=22 RepID=A0ABX5WT31_9GAMM|nr:hypothetical protein [Shewanella psychropiezotolerans]MPY25928.1 hypothetical protein [Shewanella sp. YLB-07]QDO82250.1 hypothetical protein FM037_02105 [Shewanella psychropiezotolerans]